MNCGWKLIGSQRSGTVPDRLAEKRGRRDTNHRAACPVDFEHLANSGRTAPELAIPECIADDDHGRRGRSIVVFGEDAARAGGNSQYAEVVAADDRAFDRAGRSAAAQHGLAERKIAHREQSVQHLLAGRHFPVQGIADVDRLIVFEQLHLNQRGGVAHRQRAEDNRVEYLINRGIGADARERA